MASSVPTALGRLFGQLPGVNQMTSTSSFGSSIVVLQFNLNESIDVGEQEVQAAISESSTCLPRNLLNPPIHILSKNLEQKSVQASDRKYAVLLSEMDQIA
jgi:multidrug efflux pump